MRMPSAANLGPVGAIFVGLVALTFFWYVQAIGDAADEMSSTEGWFIPTFMAAMLAVQGAMLVAAAWLGRRHAGRFGGAKRAVCVLAALLICFNFFSNFLGHLGSFMLLERWVQGAVMVAVFAFAFVFSSELHESAGLRLAVVGGGPVLLAGSLVFASLTGERAPAERTEAQAELSPGTTTGAPTVQKVTFKRKPNVYLLSFDALTTDGIAARYFNVPTPLKYSEVLEANQARVLRNAFSDREPTRPSLNSLLALDIDWFDGLADTFRYAFFTGRQPSPVIEIFRHNGYHVQTMHRTFYLGRRQGPYVDFYGVSSVEGVCDHVETRVAFLGYCSGRLRMVLSKVVPGIDRSAASRPFADLVVERIRATARDGQPWLTVAYSSSPGHADLSYDHRRADDRLAYRAEFNRNQMAAAAELRAMIATIRELDSEAIVLIFGDHGPIVPFVAERESNYLAAPEFYVQTSHAVRMAVWPASACAREFDDASSKAGFVTIAMAVRAIITCLADGLDPVHATVKYSLPYGNKDSYARYLYE